MAEAYEKLPEEDRRDAWKELATEKGWPTITPSKTAEDISHDIGGQFMMIVLCSLFGIPALLKFMSGQGTWIEGDKKLIRNSRGQEVQIDSITKIDKTKWDAKGIAKIHYEVDGKKKKFVMDDFKYDRKPMGELMRGDVQVVLDRELTEDQIETCNLICFGDFSSNRILYNISQLLPIDWTRETLRVGDQTFDPVKHVPVFCYPNPMNPERYVVVNSGMTFREFSNTSNSRLEP